MTFYLPVVWLNVKCSHIFYLLHNHLAKRERERERGGKEREGKSEPEVKYKGYNNWEGRVTWVFFKPIYPLIYIESCFILTLNTVKNSEITSFPF